MMHETRVPAALLAALERNAEPVQPLASPVRRALSLLPIAVVLLVGMPLFWRWQAHLPLAPGPSWTLSSLETALSLVILTLGFREAVPGRELSTRTLVSLITLACLVFLGINATTRSAPAVTAATWLRWMRECISMTMTFSVPALVAPALLVARALPNRPALAGGLCGLGVGLMADAGLRLFCWDGDYHHVVIAHGGAILLLSALGAASATIVERIKERRRPRIR